jgi:hypothetical protein
LRAPWPRVASSDRRAREGGAERAEPFVRLAAALGAAVARPLVVVARFFLAAGVRDFVEAGIVRAQSFDAGTPPPSG